MQLHDVHQGHSHAARSESGSAAGSARDTARPRARATRATPRARGSSSARSSRAARCRWPAASPSADSSTERSRRATPSSTWTTSRRSFEAGSVVDEKALRAKGLVKGQEFDGIKILATGALSKPLEVHATKFSGSAATKIAAAGGKTVVVPYRPHAVSGRPGENRARRHLERSVRRSRAPPPSYFSGTTVKRLAARRCRAGRIRAALVSCPEWAAFEEGIARG